MQKLRFFIFFYQIIWIFMCAYQIISEGRANKHKSQFRLKIINIIFRSSYIYLLFFTSKFRQAHITQMQKGQINVFQVKQVKKDIGFKVSAADVLNQFLYVGDESGNIHIYPIRVGESEILSRNQNQNSKSVSKYKIQKIMCYKQISTLLILAGESLMATDLTLRKPQSLATKISDFSINQTFDTYGVYSVVAITKKKQGFIFVYDPSTRKLVDLKSKFSVSQVPTSIAYTGRHIILAMKKQYESLNIDKDFAMKKGPLQAKYPFVRAIGASQILCMSDDIGLLMNPDFQPKPKDNVVVSRPVQQISLAGNYCFVLCDNVLQIYLNYDKKFSLVQELPINLAKGVTNGRPFIYNRDDLYFLYQIPYETQIKGLLDKCRIDDAISLLIQKVGPDNEQKIQELKIQAIWPLLKKMQFQKAKQLARTQSFDIRELILLYSQLLSLQMDTMKGAKPDKTMGTLIIEFVNQKAQKGKDQEVDLKKKSKLFIKEVLQTKRQFYLTQGVSGKIKKSFARAKNSLIRGPLPSVTSEQLLQIIDFTLIKWYFEMNFFFELQNFLNRNPNLYCQKYYSDFEQNLKKNPKLYQVPTLRPKLFAAFDKNDDAFDSWQKVAESSQKKQIIDVACTEAVNLLTKFQDKNGIEQKLDWILKLRPESAMRFFELTPLNFLQSDKVIKKFEKDKNDKYLELFLETIVINRNTEIQAYHTKLMLLYLDLLFKLHPKQSKQQGKSKQFEEKLKKFRTLEKNPTSRYASEPVLRKIQKCEWLLQDEIFLYSREKRHQEALRRYISKNMSEAAVKYCEQNGEQTLTIYFKMLLTMYRSYQSSKNNAALLLKKDIIIFLAQHASSSQLDPLVVLQQIPDDWMLNESQGIGGVYQFLESAISHTLHEKRSTLTAKHLSEMDYLNVQYNLVEAKRAFLRFTLKKTCCICNSLIGDRTFVVYPNANVCHQACMRKDKNANTICPVTKQDFEKTFKY